MIFNEIQIWRLQVAQATALKRFINWIFTDICRVDFIDNKSVVTIIILYDVDKKYWHAINDLNNT